jgi:Collagen triple helix repeat (20 copies).
MDFITVVIIGLVIYSVIKKVKKKTQPGTPVSDKGQDSLTLLREMMKQYMEIQDPKENINPKREAGVERVWAEAAVPGAEGTSGSNGAWGIEGIAGIEGSQGIEGTWGDEGTQGIEGTSSYESVRRIETIPSTPQREAVSGFFNPDFHPNEQELLQGIIWAEVLGRPRAVRPFRSTR